MFIDEAQINVKGGDGGAGAVAFLREARRPKGGPAGGDGGKGGDVILKADPRVATLVRFVHEIHYKGESGKHGAGRNMHGHWGEDLVVPVPLGTTVRSLDGGLLADLINPGDSFVAAQGGRGGRGNARFLSNARRAPAFAEQGEYGQEYWMSLELRLLADVALVGYPNAGKSTFISAVSAAKPKIADYPFTTLTPHLGVAVYDEEEVVLADIPGLIEGAAEGKGLGHQFLRHIERARVLLVLLDPFNHEADLATQFDVLLRELGQYKPDLLRRPRLVAITKMDSVPNPGELLESVKVEPVPEAISAVSGMGMSHVMGELTRLVTEARGREEPEIGFVVHRPEFKGVAVAKDGDGWRIEGPEPLRAVALSDVTDRDALAYLQDRLRGLGIEAALRDAGAIEGDEVHIGDFTFEYVPDAEAVASSRIPTNKRLAGAGRKRGQRRNTPPGTP